MKTIILVFALVAASLEVYSQNTKTPAQNKNNFKTTAKKDVKYWCPNTSCTFSKTQAGICPIHNLSLVQEGDYYCEPEYTAFNRVTIEDEDFPINNVQDNTRAVPNNTSAIKSQNQPGVCANGQEMKRMKAKKASNSSPENPTNTKGGAE